MASARNHLSFAGTVLLGALLATALPLRAEPVPAATDLFTDSSRCLAGHSSIHGADGTDVSIGYAWRASMMANSARDPYWLASVRREIMDHPQAREAIEDKCSTCHMPAARFALRQQGRPGTIFEHHEPAPPDPALAQLALDGVTCSVCHQITDEGLGQDASFTGGFHVDTRSAPGTREIFGPHDVDAGRTRIMNSSSAFLPAQSDHLARSEVCATCHTLFTHALDGNGDPAGELPEQTPFLEWRHSAYRDTRSCQDCHMPALVEDTPISSVLGQPRPAFSQHVFRGGNAFMLRLLNEHRDELGVTALPAELEATARRTEDYLQTHAATLGIELVATENGRAGFDLQVVSLAGHKLPSAYPSRRAWLHVKVTDADGRTVFESGALRPDGSITGNDNDLDGSRFEPHYRQIDEPGQVQIYEPIMTDHAGRVTTGLLYGARYVKDNRLLPDGFDKDTAPADVAVFGEARADDDFSAGGDRIRYRFDTGSSRPPFTVRAKLLYQTIGYRWAANLKNYTEAAEPARFIRYYEAAAGESAVTLAQADATIEDIQR